MQEIITQSNITFVIAILAVLFGVYHYFKNPQIKSDKEDALFEQKMNYMTDANERRFQSMQENFKDLVLQSNNHIHTVDVKVENLSGVISTMGQEIVQLRTIIEERIPKKH